VQRLTAQYQITEIILPHIPDALKVRGGSKVKIVGYVGSSRKEGNTAWAVNKILEGAREEGAETRSWCYSDLDIEPCKGCLGCVKSGKCVINDDMQEIYAALEQADALVIGSPVYMGQMTAQTKIFTDRLYAQATPRFSPYFKEKNAGKKLVLVYTQGNPNADLFKPYFDYTEKIFRQLEFDVRGVHIVAGMREKPACEKEGLSDAMKKIGSSLASSV